MFEEEDTLEVFPEEDRAKVVISNTANVTESETLNLVEDNEKKNRNESKYGTPILSGN